MVAIFADFAAISLIISFVVMNFADFVMTSFAVLFEVLTFVRKCGFDDSI